MKAAGGSCSPFLSAASITVALAWQERHSASRGGGIGTYWGKVRSIGEKVKTGKTSGIIPFIHVMDGLTLAISQGSLRRGSAAVYLPVSHPEIEEFVEIRRPTGGDPNRNRINLLKSYDLTDMEGRIRDLVKSPLPHGEVN